MKLKIQKKFGTLRLASVRTGINYYRLSQIVNGWRIPTDEEMKKLGVTKKDVKEAAKS